MQLEPKKQQSLDVVPVRLVNDVGLDSQVITNKLGGIRVIGVNAADLCGREENVVGFFVGEKNRLDCFLVGQVKLSVGTS